MDEDLAGVGRRQPEEDFRQLRAARARPGRRGRGSRPGGPTATRRRRRSPGATAAAPRARPRRAGPSALGKTAESSRPTIRRDEPGAVDPGARARRDGLAVAQHGDAIGDGKDLLEAVRDVDDADAVRLEQRDDAEQALDLALGQRRRRLVHDDDLRVGADRLGDLDDLLLGHAERLDQAHRDRSRRRSAAGARRPGWRAATSRAAATAPPASSARAMFSATVRSGKERRLLVDGGDAERAGAAGVHRGDRTWPCTVISPLSGVSAPVMILMRVDLPAPFSPTRAWTSPGRRSNDTPLSARTPAKDLVMEAADRSMAGICSGDDTTPALGTARPARRARMFRHEERMGLRSYRRPRPIPSRYDKGRVLCEIQRGVQKAARGCFAIRNRARSLGPDGGRRLVV